MVTILKWVPLFLFYHVLPTWMIMNCRTFLHSGGPHRAQKNGALPWIWPSAYDALPEARGEVLDIAGSSGSRPNTNWLEVEPIPLRNMSSSIGMRNFPKYMEKIKVMFQSPPIS